MSKSIVIPRLLAGALGALALDGLTKTWAVQSLELYQPVPIVGQFFRLTLNYNPGVAFGLFSDGGVLPTVLTGAILSGLSVWLARSVHAGSLPAASAWPIGLLLGGAIGNFIDRLRDGRVTDFLDVGVGATRWPTFNLADTCTVVGMVALVGLTLANERRLEVAR